MVISLEDIMQNLFSRVRNPALRQGLIIGIFLGVILLGLSFVISDLTITLILCLVAAFIAGMRASRETGRISTGTLAGMWTGLFGLLVPALISFGLLLFNLDAIRKSAQANADKQHLHITYTNSVIINNLLINFVIIIALGVLFGVVGGVGGGFLGRRRAPQLPAVVADDVTYVEASTATPQDESLSTTSPEERTSSTPPAE
jgi:hypothetical protein